MSKNRIYHCKNIDGLVSFIDEKNKMSIRKSRLTVRMTADEKGKSLSMQLGTIMFQIPLEHIINELKETIEDDKKE